MINRWIDMILPYNFTIIHRPGMRNVLPDKLSRLYPTFCWDDRTVTGENLTLETTCWDTDDYKLNPAFFTFLNRRYGPHTVDLFATSQNAFLPRHYTTQNLAFNQNWHGENGWANPPWRLLPQVIDKVKNDTATITLIAPWWPEMPWFKALRDLATADPLLLQHLDDLFFPQQQPTKKV